MFKQIELITHQCFSSSGNSLSIFSSARRFLEWSSSWQLMPSSHRLICKDSPNPRAIMRDLATPREVKYFKVLFIAFLIASAINLHIVAFHHISHFSFFQCNFLLCFDYLFNFGSYCFPLPIFIFTSEIFILLERWLPFLTFSFLVNFKGNIL